MNNNTPDYTEETLRMWLEYNKSSRTCIHEARSTRHKAQGTIYVSRVFVLIIVGLFLISGMFIISTEGTTKVKLKIMTLNIKGDGDNYTLGRWANFIASEEPDIVGLQEVMWYYYSGNNQAKKIADTLKNQFKKNYYYTYKTQQSYLIKGIGVAVLSKYPIIYTDYRILKKNPGDFENRIILFARIDTPLHKTNFFVTHLTHNDRTYAYYQAMDITNWTSRFVDRPMILAGDFNSNPATKTYSHIKTYFTDTWATLHGTGGGFTFPSWNAKNRIDYIFTNLQSGAKIITSGVRGNSLVSDHLAVVSVVEVSR